MGVLTVSDRTDQSRAEDLLSLRWDCGLRFRQCQRQTVKCGSALYAAKIRAPVQDHDARLRSNQGCRQSSPDDSREMPRRRQPGAAWSTYTPPPLDARPRLL